MGTGGIRFGAGRPLERRTVEQAMSLDVRSMHRDGCLVPGFHLTPTWTWKRWDGVRTASIGVTVGERELSLSYSINGEPVQQTIWRDSTPCHFGGCREWIICPRCGIRVAVVYFGRHRFACRTCNNLAYSSQQLDVIDRSWRKQRRIEKKMGGENAIFKPPRMRQATWQRLRAQLAECEQTRLHALVGYVRALGRRFPDLAISTPHGTLRPGGQ